MRTISQSGFSTVKLLVILLSTAVLLLGGWYATVLVINSQRSPLAEAAAKNFVEAINENRPDDGYDLFSDDLKNVKKSGSNFSFWLSSFSRNKITINTDQKSAIYNSGLFSTMSQSTFLFDTSNGAQVKVELIYKDGKWLVGNYSVV